MIIKKTTKGCWQIGKHILLKEGENSVDDRHYYKAVENNASVMKAIERGELVIIAKKQTKEPVKEEVSPKK
jgi:hypothetical protein